ncbi:hypothetical protein L9F63_012805, partial [Diploptera punctata]
RSVSQYGVVVNFAYKLVTTIKSLCILVCGLLHENCLVLTCKNNLKGFVQDISSLELGWEDALSRSRTALTGSPSFSKYAM